MYVKHSFSQIPGLLKKTGTEVEICTRQVQKMSLELHTACIIFYIL